MINPLEKITSQGPDQMTIKEVIDQLDKQVRFMSRKDRIKIIADLTDKYVMDKKALNCLATWILQEELMDKHPDKMTREAYPIMSDSQYKRRLNGEVFESEFNIGTGFVIGYRTLRRSDNTERTNRGKQAIYAYPK